MTGSFLTINGDTVATLFFGLTPGLVGVFQLNVHLPENMAVGDGILALGLSRCITIFASCNLHSPITYSYSRTAKLPVRAAAFSQ